MSKSNLRMGIIILTIATALIHLSLGGALFILNGLGYLALLVAFFWPPSFLKVSKKLVYNVYLVYSIVTIILYFVMNIGDYGVLGLVTKAIEVGLVLALWQHKS